MKETEMLIDIRAYCYMCLKNNIKPDLKKIIDNICNTLSDGKEYLLNHEI